MLSIVWLVLINRWQIQRFIWWIVDFDQFTGQIDFQLFDEVRLMFGRNYEILEKRLIARKLEICAEMARRNQTLT